MNGFKCLFVLLLQFLFVSNEDNEDDPCDKHPCGKYALCENFSSGRYLCKCDRNGKYPVGNPYQGCRQCNSDSGNAVSQSVVLALHLLPVWQAAPERRCVCQAAASPSRSEPRAVAGDTSARAG